MSNFLTKSEQNQTIGIHIKDEYQEKAACSIYCFYYSCIQIMAHVHYFILKKEGRISCEEVSKTVFDEIEKQLYYDYTDKKSFKKNIKMNFLQIETMRKEEEYTTISHSMAQVNFVFKCSKEIISFLKKHYHI
ncbi:MAG: hypothetical protein IPN94_17265 [Sphingobacteriales bacterium]|nr:hypothetical protein [Sphingobacteriales bacterium]